MRVQVVEAIPERIQETGKEFSDVAVDLALKNFFLVVESDDSLFVAEQFRMRSAHGSDEEKTCLGTTALRFRSESHARDRTLHFSLLEKLSELLRNAGSAETLTAQLALSQAPANDPQAGLAIQVNLAARGNSAEQAGLRWGLGLAHVQQALLFTSRQLRQQIGQDAD
jgi:hypothetical protein